MLIILQKENTAINILAGLSFNVIGKVIVFNPTGKRIITASEEDAKLLFNAIIDAYNSGTRVVTIDGCNSCDN